jgi:hypothetical protein
MGQAANWSSINFDSARSGLNAEFGHDTCLDHLSSDYHEALRLIGAKLFGVAKRGAIK